MEKEHRWRLVLSPFLGAARSTLRTVWPASGGALLCVLWLALAMPELGLLPGLGRRARATRGRRDRGPRPHRGDAQGDRELRHRGVPEYATVESLVGAADAALYQAKRGGKEQLATATLRGQTARKKLASVA